MFPYLAHGFIYAAEQLYDKIFIAEAYVACQTSTSGSEFAISVLGTNEKAVAILRTFGFEARPESPWRMFLGAGSAVGSPAQVLAIGSAAKG